MNIPELVRKHWCGQDGELIIGNFPISKLAGRYGPPAFLYDQAVIDRNFRRLKEALPERFQIAYSMKANPNPAFVSLFVDRGCGIEIASAGEFHLARIAGCAPGDMFFAGP